MSVTPEAFRAVLGRFASGVTILTARDAGGMDHGMTISAFSSVSLIPPMVLACVDRAAEMHDVLAVGGDIGISILSAEQEQLSRRFAEAESGRFEGVAYRRAASGVALLDGALAHLECRIATRHDAGDHSIFVADVVSAAPLLDGPLLYYRGGYAQLER